MRSRLVPCFKLYLYSKPWKPRGGVFQIWTSTRDDSLLSILFCFAISPWRYTKRHDSRFWYTLLFTLQEMNWSWHDHPASSSFEWWKYAYSWFCFWQIHLIKFRWQLEGCQSAYNISPRGWLIGSSISPYTCLLLYVNSRVRSDVPGSQQTPKLPKISDGRVYWELSKVLSEFCDKISITSWDRLWKRSLRDNRGELCLQAIKRPVPLSEGL